MAFFVFPARGGVDTIFVLWKFKIKRKLISLNEGKKGKIMKNWKSWTFPRLWIPGISWILLGMKKKLHRPQKNEEKKGKIRISNEKILTEVNEASIKRIFPLFTSKGMNFWKQILQKGERIGVLQWEKKTPDNEEREREREEKKEKNRTRE